MDMINADSLSRVAVVLLAASHCTLANEEG